VSVVGFAGKVQENQRNHHSVQKKALPEAWQGNKEAYSVALAGEKEAWHYKNHNQNCHFRFRKQGNCKKTLKKSIFSLIFCPFP